MSALAMLRRGRVAAALALAAGALAVAGCGDDALDSADTEAGKQTFVTLCAQCHTLEAAGTPPATIGPDLDDAFRAARQVGMEETQFAGVVERWIEIAQLPMPRNLVSGQDKTNVAAYIAEVAGTQPDSSVRPAPPPTPEIPNPSRQQIAD
jgi:mono/diheme cytochrome c family protein